MSAVRPRGEFLVGDRILTSGRKGVVHFMGLVKFATGKYVGIELDLPEGKHDGSMKGDRYFSCPPNHGVFVKPSMVQLDPDVPSNFTSTTGAASTSSKPASRQHSRRPSLEQAQHDQTPTTAPTTTATMVTPTPVPQPIHITPTPITPNEQKQSEVRASATASPIQPQLPTTPRATIALPSLADLKTSPAPSPSTSSASPQQFGFAPIAISTTAAGVPVAAVTLNLSPASSPTATSAPVSYGPSAEQLRLQASFDSLQTTHSKLGLDFKQLQVAFNQLQTEKTLIEDEARKFQQELSMKDRQLSELKTELSESQAGNTQVESLQHMVESLTVDKELAEEQNESSLAELENLKNNYSNLELEFQLLKEQHSALQFQHEQSQQQQQAVSGGGTLITNDNLSSTEQSGVANQKLVEQNKLLTDALLKLRDLNLAEKQTSTARIAELEKINASLSQADAENTKFKAEMTTAQAAIASLKEQLDEALNLESMVEKLSQQKLDLEEELREAKRNIQHLQSIAETNEELEEGYKEFQQQLQRELEVKESDLNDLNQRYKLKTVQIEDLQATNRKFRAIVNQLETENQQLKAKTIELERAGGANSNTLGDQQLQPLSGLAATRSSSLLQQRLKQVRTAHLDQLLTSVERDLCEKRYQFLQLYIPSNVNIDDRSLNFLQLLERIKNKSQVLGSVWAEFYGALNTQKDDSNQVISIDYSSNGTSPELALLTYNACLLIASIIHACENLTAALYTLDLESYNSLCIRSMSELSPLENILDSYLNMIASDTLNELTSLQSLLQVNWILYNFLVEKVPMNTFLSSTNDGSQLEELNVLPYSMSIGTIIKKGSQVNEETQKWNELTNNFRSRIAGMKKPQLTPSMTALLPSAVPSLSTFALTLSYSTSLSQTYAQLISEQLTTLMDALRKGRAKKQLELDSERKKKERQESISNMVDINNASGNASLADYNTSVDDHDIGIYQQLWSEIADATLNNLSLANQLHQTSMRNYNNSLNAISGKEEERAKHEKHLLTLLPHIHTIDQCSQTTSLQLATLLQAIRPLLQVEHLNELTNGISIDIPALDSEPFHPVLKQLMTLLKGAKSAPDAQPTLLAGLTQLRSELFSTSKKIMSITEDNASAQSSDSDSAFSNSTTKAIHQRTTSFVLTAPVVQEKDTASRLASIQPWFHHPLTIRDQLSSTAALRTSVQDLTHRLSEKQKELFGLQKLISEEKAKQDVLKQQLDFHMHKSSQFSEYTAMNENLKAQLDESQKQLTLLKAEMDKLSKENRAVRKQMLKLKSQYLKDEQTRTQQVGQPGAGGVGGSSGSAITNLAALSSANLTELLGEIDLLRRTLAAQREELASWKTRQTLHELQTMLPPLPTIEPTPRIVQPATFNRTIPAVVIPSPISIAVVPKLLGTLDSNPLLASMPPLPPVAPARSTATAPGEAEANEFRFLRSKLTEMAQEVWKQRITPKIVKVVDPQRRAREEAESKRKEDAEKEEEKSNTSTVESPFQQYLNDRLHAVHIQQCCDQLNQRVNRMADQQRLKQWTTIA